MNAKIDAKRGLIEYRGCIIEQCYTGGMRNAWVASIDKQEVALANSLFLAIELVDAFLGEQEIAA